MFNRTSIGLATLTVVVGSIAFGGVTSATAQPPVIVQAHRHYLDENQREVPYGDLDLAVVSGQKTLLNRISGAVDNICDVNTGTTDMETVFAVRNCKTIAWNSANPQLSRVFAFAMAGNKDAALATMASLVIAAP